MSTTRFRRRVVRALVVVQVLGLLASAVGSIPASVFAAGNSALQFDGSSQYVSFGASPGLNASTFTLETWFKWTGGGTTTTSGTGGVTAIPLLTKGRGEAENSNVDMNYFLGIAGGKLVADYEEGAGQTSPALNHPITAATTITTNVWHHAAATFDGTTLRLYLDGALDGTVVVGAGRLPRSDSIQHAALGSALTSTGAAQGFFSGVIDEARVWNVARSEAQIGAAKNTEIAAQAGLIGAWHLNAGSGTTAVDGSGLGISGTLLPVATPPTWVTGFDVTAAAIQLNGSSQYVSFGASPGLNASTFTLETWFKWTGGGTTTTSGTGGVTAIPLLTKGRGEAENSNVDMNYFLGIAGGKLVADYEEGAGQTSPALNHPITAATTITTNVWHHAAATFDGTTLRLYLDGALDGTVVVGAGRLPRSDSIQHAALGSALTSTGAAQGFFSGVIDEARVWNVARSEAQIGAAKNTEIAAQAGLIGAWHLNAGSGTTAVDGSGLGISGTLLPVANGPGWTDGFIPPSVSPGVPVISAPADGATGASTSPTLDVVVSDADSATLSVSFFGRPLASGQFTLIGTQAGVASGAHATMPWPDRGGGQTYEWYATVTDGALMSTSPTWTFHTAAGTGTVVIGVGDIASCTSTGDEATAAITAGLDGPIFTTGDNVYQTGLASEYANCYEPSWGPFKSRTRPVPGNHDWGNTTPGSIAGYTGYFGANATDAGGKTYYSYDLDADWHVVNLDSECANVTGGCAAGSPQHTWLVADLAANTGKNVMAVWHKPRFSSGITNLTAMQAIVDALYVAGVDLVFVGHDHIYERFQPLDPSGAYDPAYGIRHFTIGTGGASVQSAGAQKPTSEALDDETFGVMRLVLHPTSYEWRFLPVAGETFTDSGTGTVHDAPPGPGENGLDLGSSGAYVTFADPAKLDLATFTIETWFMRTGTGIAGTTGTGGITIVPLVTHGGPQAEGSDVDANWILGINTTGNVIAADFEDTATGLNHPVSGITAITNDVWHHAAATYDGTTWRLYLDGALEATEVENATPRSDSIQHTGLGVMLLSGGGAANTARFDGVLDETRVWNNARTLGQIRSTVNTELTTGTGGLVARWGMDEGSVPTVDDSISPFANGTITGNGATRVPGSPFDIPIDGTAPAAPAGLDASPGDGTVGLTWTANGESDLAGYNVYRSTTLPVALTSPLNGGILVTSPAYTDATAANGTTYHYVVTAVDDSGNQSGPSSADSATPAAPPELQTGLDLGSAGAYVTFLDPAQLDLAQFTIETWFKRTGAGVANETGTNGIDQFIPLVTHGGPDDDGSAIDANWLLGIDDATDVLAADFEEGAAGSSPGLNHPVRGVTPIANDVWHHAAATYDGTTWRLYLDGHLEATLAVGQPVRSDTTQHAGLGVMLDTSGAPANTARFAGVLDEVRVWNAARAQTEIRSGIHQAPPSTGLVARWGMGEAPGATVGDSVAPDADGTIVGSGVTRPAGATFDIPTVHAGPDQTVTLPASGFLDGVALDDGLPGGLTTTWTQVGGADSADISNPSAATTSVSFSGSGTGSYVFRLTAGDGANSVFDEVTVNVLDPGPATNFGLDFDGTDDHVAFGDPAALKLANFTIETWFRRDGAGTTTGTGDGGITAAVPLLTKGRSENDGSNVDMNYFLGIDGTTGLLVADFEEGASGTTPGLNHPVSGTTVIQNATWYHAAATYDGTTWKLYLNGILEKTLAVGQPVRADSTQDAGLGAAMNSSGTPAGAFNGVLDEARIWNNARTEAQIQAAMTGPLTTSPGLVARWGMDEGTGPAIASSAGSTIDGTLTNGPQWVAGTPFVSTANLTPNVPSLVAPSNGATGVATSPTLQTTVSDPNGGSLSTSFYGRTAGPAAAEDFTIVVLPDTQHYSDSATREATYRQQTQWIADNADDLNVVFVSHLGDITENFDTIEVEWQRADAAMAILDAAGIPNNLAPGNHDLGAGGTTSNYYDQYFPPSRYNLPANEWYGGWLGEEAGQVQRLNKDNYELFTAGGIDFLIIHLEIDMPTFAVQWANEIIDRYPDRQVIVSTHAFVNTSNARPSSRVTTRSDGQSAATVWSNLISPNCNVFMVVNGHYPGEGRLTSDNSCSEPVHQVLTDYQSRANGGDGWLRYYTFKPSEDRIDAFTYSPRLGTFETDASSEFSLAYPMSGLGGFELLGTVDTPSGSTASMAWPGRAPSTGYEWYAVTTDGVASQTSPTWTFTTGAGSSNNPPVVTNPGPQTTLEGTVVDLPIEATDPDTDPLAYSATGLPAGLSISPTTGHIAGTLSFDASAGNPHDVIVTVADGNGPPVQVAFTWTATHVNREPTFDQDLADRTSPEGTLVNLDAGATDPDADPLTYAATNLPPGLAINTSSGLITGTIGATASSASPYAVSITVRDGATVDATDTFSWTVTDVPAGTGIALRSVTYGSNHSESLTTIGLARPAGVIAGDVLLASIDTRGSSTVSAPAGWTLVQMHINGTSLRKSTYVKVAGAAEPATYTWTFSAARLAAGAIHAYTGVDTANPIDASGGQIVASSTTVTAPSITTTVADTMLVAFFATMTDATWTPPAAMTERGELIGTAPSKFSSTTGADAIRAAIGATGTRVATSSKAANSVAHLVALRPAAGGPPPVNNEPTFDQDLADRTSPEGTLVNLDAGATDPDADPLTYAATNLPPGLAINTSSGLITGTIGATASSASPYAVSITVRDGATVDATDTFSWTVTDVPAPNNEPTFDQDLADRTSPEGTLVNLDAGATDPDADPLTYAATNLPPGLAINTSSGLITGTIGATASSASPYAVSITVRDGATVDATDTFSWTVTDVPAGTGIALRSVTYGSNHSESLTTIGLARPAGVIAGDVLLASIDTRGSSTVSAPAGWTLVQMHINGTSLRKSTYVKVAGAAEPATYTWTFSAARLAAGAIHAYTGVDTANPIDASGGQIVASSTTVTAPSITTTVADTMLVAFFATMTDATWTPPAAMTERGELIGTAPSKFSSTTGADAIRAAIGATGTRVATSSKAANSVAHLVALRPAAGGPPPVNNEPTFDQDLADRTSPEGTLVNLDAGATDPDADPLTYAATNLPPGLAINTSSGLITGTIGATASSASPYAVSITVRDGATVDATDTFSWTVTDVPAPNNEPTFDQDLADRTSPEGTLVNLDAGATDPDADPLTYAATNLPPGLAINTSSGLITGTIGATASSASPYAVSITVRDGATVDATDTFSWTVTDVPAGTGIALRSVTYGSNHSESLTTIGLARPAGVIAGDVLLASIDTRGSSTVSAPAGWTLVQMHINGTSLRKSTYVKVAGAAEPATYTWTFSAARLAAGAIHAYTGVDTANPIDASGGQIVASSTTVTAPSITTTVADTMLVAFFATMTDATWTPPAAMTERGELIGTAPSKFSSTTGADAIRAAIGATGTRVATSSKAANSVAHLVALRPAAGP